MRRLVFNVLTFVSLAACLGFIGVWVWSYYQCGEVLIGTGRPHGVSHVVIGLAPGQVGAGGVAEYLDTDDPDPRRDRWVNWRLISYPPASARKPARTLVNRIGFDRVKFRSAGGSLLKGGDRMARFSFDTVWVPTWAAVLGTMILPVVWFRRRRRMMRWVREGRCLRCGYDLRASGARCPECGDVVGPVGGISTA